jgi:hypothetical protein
LLLLSLVAAHYETARRTDLLVFENKKRAGIAVFTAAEQPLGGRSTSLSLILYGGTMNEIAVNEIETVDNAGRQTASKLVLRSKLGTETTQATFGSDGTTHVTLTRQGVSSTRVIQAPKRASRKDPSAYWFVVTRPSPGMWLTCVHFSPAKLEWESMRTTYVGRKPVTVAGRSVMGNEIVQSVPGETDTYWLDDQGDPIVIDTGKTRFERK